MPKLYRLALIEMEILLICFISKTKDCNEKQENGPEISGVKMPKVSLQNKNRTTIRFRLK
jgi:hypothetical protein